MVGITVAYWTSSHGRGQRDQTEHEVGPDKNLKKKKKKKKSKIELNKKTTIPNLPILPC